MKDGKHTANVAIIDPQILLPAATYSYISSTVYSYGTGSHLRNSYDIGKFGRVSHGWLSP